jgi:hypothetical protein
MNMGRGVTKTMTIKESPLHTLPSESVPLSVFCLHGDSLEVKLKINTNTNKYEQNYAQYFFINNMGFMDDKSRIVILCVAL